LVSASAFYGLGGLATSVLGLISVPIFTRQLAPSAFGHLSLITALLFLVTVVVVLGLDDATQRWYGLADDEADRKTTFATWIWCQLTISLVIATALFVLARPLASSLIGDGSVSGALQWAAISVPLASLRTLTVNWLRMQERARAAAAYGVTVAIFCAAGSIVFVGVVHRGVAGFFIGQALGLAAGALLSIWLMRGWMWPGRADRHRLRLMLIFAIPLVPTAVGTWVVNLLDRYVLEALDGASAVGRYQIAYAVAGIAALVTTGFQLAWMPYAYRQSKRPDARDVYARAFLGYVAVCGVTAAVVSALAPEAVRLIAPPSYDAAATAVPALAFSYVFIGLTYVAMTGPSLRGVTTPIAVGTLLAAVATIALDLALIPSAGVTGASVATLLAWVVQPAWVFWRGARVYPVAYPFARAAVVLAACGLTGVLGVLAHNGPLSWVTGVKVAMLCLLVAFTAALARGRR
jgi:O-antigen/teichoic acid export membrane protein